MIIKTMYIHKCDCTHTIHLFLLPFYTCALKTSDPSGSPCILLFSCNYFILCFIKIPCVQYVCTVFRVHDLVCIHLMNISLVNVDGLLHCQHFWCLQHFIFLWIRNLDKNGRALSFPVWLYN